MNSMFHYLPLFVSSTPQLELSSESAESFEETLSFNISEISEGELESPMSLVLYQFLHLQTNQFILRV